MDITLKQLADILAAKRGAMPTTIVSETVPSLTGGKKCPLLAGGTIIKRQITNGVANFLYERAVNRVREKEEQPLTNSGSVEIFRSEPRKWGCRLHLGPYLLPFVHHVSGLVMPSHRDIVSINNLPHADELYLELKCQQVGKVEYFQAGKLLDPETVEKFLRDRKEGARQQVDNPVVLRDYKMVNLRRITIDGTVYELSADLQA